MTRSSGSPVAGLGALVLLASCDHLASADIRGKDTLAFQRLWNRNHPSDKIAEDGEYGPQTEARLRQSRATGFAIGASCAAAAHVTSVVAVDGPDPLAGWRSRRCCR